jgi:hypothetical protein
MPEHALSLLRRLAGEWEGTVQGVDADGMTSSSIVSASMRLEESGRVLASRFDGRLFGKEFDGGSVWRVDGKGLAAVWSDNRAPGNVRVDAASGSDANSLTLDGRATLPGMKSASAVRQVVSLSDNDVTLNIEWQVQNAKGVWTKVLGMEMHRMQEGTTSSAADRFAEGSVLASLRRAAGASAQASVRE